MNQNKIDLAWNFFKQGDFSSAENILVSLDNNFHNYSSVKELFSYIYANTDRVDLSIELLKEACSMEDASPEAHYYLGAYFLSNEQFSDAIISFSKSLKIGGNFFEVIHDLATAHARIGNLKTALEFYLQCLSFNNNSFLLFFNIATIYNDLKNFSKALTHYDRAIELKSDYAEAWMNKGVTLYELKQFKEALTHYDRAIELKSDYAEAWMNKGVTLYKLKQYSIATKCYEKALDINPTFDYLMGDLFFTKMMICDWSNYDLQVNYLLRNIYKKEKITRPFSILGLVDSPELLQISAEVYSSDLFKDIKSISIKIHRGPLKKIKIGYFSADFYNHATSYLMAELFEKHNREKFEIIGFSFGESPNDHMFKRIASSMDEFHLVKNLSDLEIAKFSRDIGIDIAVDLKGYTYNARPNIFSHRCAPIQINYLGFPGTLGSNNYDYIIADSFIVPQHNQKFYTEKIIYLPHCYQVNDSKKAISSTQYRKKDFGLPDNKFIYCSFNNTYKITPIIFDAWMQILKTVENSVLWLFEENEIAANNLRIEAKKTGVDMNRLIFAERLPLDEHLSRLQLADLFIDTFPCNGHTTTSDALWAGIPGVTLAGESFSSRVAGSLLNTIGAPELITYSINDYINLAIDLASSREKFFNIKNKVAVNRITSPLFDINLFTENIELTYQRIYTNSLSNS
jgi:predicted O-linked N-acetylglucosamine transferase (SPINDLY family)